ncbi:MAG: DNA-deoxyinosine glycosylase [Methylococcaceae bacterium]
MLIESFPPLIAEHCKVLVLGSMPGEESLRRQQYYAHPRNAFWPIMQQIFGWHETTYELRSHQLVTSGVAVWGVLQRCTRSGSLDASIDPKSIEVNDFDRLLNRYSAINSVFFNGGTAAKVFNKNVLPKLSGDLLHLSYQQLPSTSPAHAAMTLNQKTAAWKVLLEKLV